MAGPLTPDIAVNGATIPADEIAAEAQSHPAPAGKPGLAWRRAARALTVRQLFPVAAAACSIAATPRQIGPGTMATEDDATIRALRNAELTLEALGEAEMRAIYDQAPGGYDRRGFLNPRTTSAPRRPRIAPRRPSRPNSWSRHGSRIAIS